MAPSHNCVLPHALNLPSTRKLAGKRVVLASASPRRKEILQTIVRRRVSHSLIAAAESSVAQGLAPEIIVSTFKEDLPIHAFGDPHEYPVATATQKAVEVYERLVVRLTPLVTRWPSHNAR